MTRTPMLLLLWSCQAQESQQAEALLASALQQQVEQGQEYVNAISTSRTGADVAAAISACLSQVPVPLYGLEISVLVNAAGLQLVSLAGTTDLLTQDTQDRCIHDVLQSAQPSVHPVLAAASPAVFEGHDLVLFQTTGTPAQQHTVPVVRYQDVTTPQHTPMALVNDLIYDVNTPWEEQPLPAALLGCETTDFTTPAGPLLLALRLQEATPGGRAAQCTVSDGAPSAAYADCLCAAYQTHMASTDALDIELTITQVTPDGQTVSSTLEASSAGTVRHLWLLRQQEDGGVRYRSHTRVTDPP